MPWKLTSFALKAPEMEAGLIDAIILVQAAYRMHRFVGFEGS